jgi:DNA-binding MarR family transcriptional regulator
MGMSQHLETTVAKAMDKTDEPTKNPRPQMDEVLEFLRLLWAVDNRMQCSSKHMAARLGVTGPQRLVMQLVGRFPGITAGRLAQILHVHPSTLTGVLRRLEQRGQVVRKPDPGDGRKSLFFLTSAGRALDVPSSGTLESAVQRMLARMPKARLEEAQDVLTVLAEELGIGTAPIEDPTASSFS